MSTRKRLALLVAGAAFVAALPLAGTASAKTKEACKLLTVADVGKAFADTATQIQGEGGTCQWALSTGPGPVVFVGIDKVSAVSKEDFESNSKSPTAEKVPGLKKSFFDEGTVTFIKGKNFVNVQYPGTTLDAATVKAALSELAKKLAKKL